jgi:PAS domain S-box-containing protein
MKTKSAASTSNHKPNHAGGDADRSGSLPAASNLGRSRGIALEEAIHRYVELYDFAPIPYVSFDRTGRIEEINLAAVQLFGRSRKALIGSPFSLYVAAEDASLFHGHLQRCRSAEPRVTTELRLKNAQHQIVRVHLSSTPITSTMRDGALLFQTAIVDLTEPIRAQENLRESEARFRALVSQSAAGICRTDLNGKLTFVNRKTCEMLGYAESELLGRTIRELTLPEDLRDQREVFEQVRAEGKSFQIEKRLVRKDKSLIWVSISASPIRDETGKLQSAVAVILDISERKRAEKSLRQTEERFRLLVSGAKEYAMFLIDPKNRITFWSSGAERVFGWTAEEAIGKQGSLVFTPQDRSRGEVEKEMAIAIRDGRAPDRRWHLRKDGSRVWIDGVMHRLDDERTGGIRGFAKIARDATDRRRAEDELRHARDQLEQRVLERSADLMATNNELERTIRQREQLERELLDISERERRRIGQDLHDVVCQELTATALFLKSTGNRVTNREAAKTLSEAAMIVNRNVAVARELARGFQPIFAGASALVSALRGLCKKANEVPHIHCSLKLPRAIRIHDETLALNLFRVAQEAVRNAVNHSGGTEIIICIERERDFVRLVVEDNGQGFTPRKRSKGLGLHIMRYRTNALGGTLQIDSRAKRGTRIVCEVPTKK